MVEPGLDGVWTWWRLAYGVRAGSGGQRFAAWAHDLQAPTFCEIDERSDRCVGALQVSALP